jgi:hypothetical protein
MRSAVPGNVVRVIGAPVAGLDWKGRARGGYAMRRFNSAALTGLVFNVSCVCWPRNWEALAARRLSHGCSNARVQFGIRSPKDQGGRGPGAIVLRSFVILVDIAALPPMLVDLLAWRPASA